MLKLFSAAVLALDLLTAQVIAAGAPTITSFSPTSGSVGSTVTINGSNFIPPLSITFGGNVQAAGSFTGTEITVTVPSGAQTGEILLTTGGGTAETPAVFTITSPNAPLITASSASGSLGQPFSYQIDATHSPTSYAVAGLPAGLSLKQDTGVISGSPTALGAFSVTLSATNTGGTGHATLALTVLPLPFFTGETNLGNGVYYLRFANNQDFGEYSYLPNPNYIYSYDLSSYEYLDNANDGKSGIYLYDFNSSTFFYTSPTFSYPYLYDFTLKSVLYFYQGTSNPRYFYDFATSKIITK